MRQAVTACTSPLVSSAWRAAQVSACTDDGDPSTPTTILLRFFPLAMLVLPRPGLQREPGGDERRVRAVDADDHRARRSQRHHVVACPAGMDGSPGPSVEPVWITTRTPMTPPTVVASAR